MKNKEIMVNNKIKVKELEQEYIDDMIKKMPEYIEKQKEEIVKEIIQYAETHKKPLKYDKEGKPIGEKITLNPLVINNYFFKPITNLSCIEPIYSAEQLGLIYDYYCYVIAEINDKIGYFPTSLTSFCKLCSITLNTLRTYRNSTDYAMRVVVEKIYDQIGDENITMSQMGMVRERTTMFKMKSQNELVEKQQPNININITEKPDFEKIEERISKYKQFTSKKDKK